MNSEELRHSIDEAVRLIIENRDDICAEVSTEKVKEVHISYDIYAGELPELEINKVYAPI